MRNGTQLRTDFEQHRQRRLCFAVLTFTFTSVHPTNAAVASKFELITMQLFSISIIICIDMKFAINCDLIRIILNYSTRP